MGDIIQRLTTVAEDLFDCSWGPSMAFFEIPQRDADIVRVIYRTYGVRGNDIDALEQWMLNKVLFPLSEKAGACSDPRLLRVSRLYWRLTTCFDVSVLDDELYYLRTRLAVLDAGLNEVMLESVIKPEGGEWPTI